MWCIPEVTPEFCERMDHILELYEQPYDPAEPVVCFDEKTLQLLEDVRPPQYGKINKRDSHYRRKGTTNIFVAVEPQGGFRSTRVSAYRKKPDFAKEIKRITELSRYRNARTIHIVMDNLNTHTERSLVETFGEKKARKILDRVTFHYTPAHASWLNMAEIEISVMSRQCLTGRVGNYHLLRDRLARWRQMRNRHAKTIQWKFTRDDAKKVFRQN